MKRIYLSLLLCYISFVSFGQNATQYSFSSSTGSLTDISTAAGTVATSDISLDDAVQTGIDIGFAFNYCGTNYTTLSACSNGWLSLANSNATLPANEIPSLSTIANGVGLLMPMWDDMDGSIGGATAYYQVSGTAPFRVFTFQWGNATTPWGTFGSIGSGMFQVRLHESTNAIQFLYDNGATTSLLSATIGIASSITHFQTLTSTGSGATSSAFSDVVDAYPANGTIMTWLPAPTINATPGTLNFSAGVSSASVSQNAHILANGITSGSVTVSAPTDFQVFNGTTWVASYNVPVSVHGMGYIDTTVAVRFVAPATAGPYTGDLDFTSTGAATSIITLNGTALPLCTGTPTPGTVNATQVTGSCSPYVSDLTLTGTTTGVSGITYQWQTSTDDITYANVSGATNASYTANINSERYYRAMIGCSHSGLVDSTPGVLHQYDAPPTAITGTTSLCIGALTTLSSTPTGGTWTSNNTAVVTIGSATGAVVAVMDGTTTIDYEAPNGCVVTTGVTVNPDPSLISGTVQVCLGATSTLINTGGGTWSSSDITITTIGSTDGVYSGLVLGTAIITYTLPTSCKVTQVVTVNPLPSVYSVTGGGAYCAGGAGVNVGISNSQNGFTYSLYNGASLITTQTGTGTAVSFGSRPAAVYTAIATSPENCSIAMTGSATVTMTMTVVPVVSVVSTPDDTVCAGTATTFTATPVNGGTTPAYAWTVNGTTVASTSSTYTYTPVNGDLVSVALTSNIDCPVPATVNGAMNIVVVPTLTPTVSIVVGPNDTICQFSTAVFTVASSSNGGTDPVYTWFKNGVTTGITGSTYAYVPINGNVISVKLNSNYRCPVVNNVSSNNITMRVDSTYIPVVNITASNGLEIAPGETTYFTATVTKGGPTPTYQWLKNGLAVAGATSNEYHPTTLVNNDSVTCVVWGTGDCSFFTFNSVKVKVTTGFVHTTTSDFDVTLVPNPNAGEFVVKGTLSASNNTPVSLEVTNMLGQTVFSNNVTAVSGLLNERVQISNSLPDGMYMLNVRTETENKVFRFIVKH